MDDSAIVVKSKCFPANLISSLQRLRYDGKFCDVTIKCADSEFKAHKNVLASETEYFESMFSYDTKEASTGIVDFSHVRTEVVKQCLDFVYTGKVEISAKTVKDVLNLTEMMQLSELARLCVAFLAERISMENCAEMVALSYLHCKESLSVKIGIFLSKNFEEFIQTEDFYSLEYGCLQHCLNSLQNTVTGRVCEIQKWNGMLSWVSYDLEERKNRFFKLFETMDLSYLSKDFLKETILSQPLVNQSNDCLAFIAKYYAADQPGPPRKRKKFGVQVLYFENESEMIVHYDVASDKYLPPIPLPHGFSDDSSVVFHKGCIYAGDGQIVSRYQFSEGTWDFVHPDIDTRGFHATFSGNLSPCYSRCVGIGSSVFMVTSHYIYQYTIGDSRLSLESLRNPLPRMFFIAASWDRIFIMSQCEDCRAFVFDISTKLCSRIKGMPAPCSFGLAVWYDQRIFTFCHAHRRNEPSPATIVSVYDPKIDTWASLPDIEVNGIPKSFYITDKLHLTGKQPEDICAKIDLDYLKSIKVQIQRKRYLKINN